MVMTVVPSLILIILFNLTEGERINDLIKSRIGKSIDHCMKKVSTKLTLVPVQSRLFSCIYAKTKCQEDDVSFRFMFDKGPMLRKDLNGLCGFVRWSPSDYILDKNVPLLKIQWFIQMKTDSWKIKLQLLFFYIPVTEKCTGNRMIVSTDPSTVLCGLRINHDIFIDKSQVSMTLLWALETRTEDDVKLVSNYQCLQHIPPPLEEPIPFYIIAPFKMFYPLVNSPQGQDAKFLVQVKTHHIIRITNKLGSDGLTIYDGPDNTFPIIMNKSSGFILFIHAFKFNKESYIEFESRQQSDLSQNCIAQITNDSFILSGSNLKSVFCRVWFETNQYASIFIQKFTALITGSCQLFGLSLGFMKDDSLIVLPPLCRNYPTFSDAYFATPNKSMYVFLYIYRAFKIDIRLSIKDSFCQGIPILCGTPITYNEIASIDRGCKITVTTSQCLYLFHMFSSGKLSNLRVIRNHMQSFKASVYINDDIDDNNFSQFQWLTIYNQQLIREIVYIESGDTESKVHDNNNHEIEPFITVLFINELFENLELSPVNIFIIIKPALCIEVTRLKILTKQFYHLCGTITLDVNLHAKYKLYTFSIRLQKEYEIDLMMRYTDIFCSYICMTVNELFLKDGNLIETKFYNILHYFDWHSLSNELHITLRVTMCLRLSSCFLQFEYRPVLRPQFSLSLGNIYRECNVESSEYIISDVEFMSWKEARNYCQRYPGFDMLSIASRKELRTLLTVSFQPDICVSLKNIWKAPLIFIGLQKNQMNQWKWTNDEPLVFSDWFQSSQFPFNFPQIEYNTEIKIETNILQMLQPHINGKCTGMMPINHYKSSNWLQISCDEKFKAAVVCEKIKDRSLPPSSQKNISMNQFCPSKWNFISGKCIRALMKRNSKTLEADMSYKQAVHMCASEGGEIFSFNKTQEEKVKSFLNSWKLSKARVWINGVDSDCRVVTISEDEIKVELVSCTNQITYITLCQTEILNKSSLEFFTCRNGMFLVEEAVCDVIKDCPDGEDEIDCPQQPCPPGLIPCESGKCIIAQNVCDRKCTRQDTSLSCKSAFPACPEGYFRCANGQCIHSNKTCDFYFDCPGKDDEKNCDLDKKCQQKSCFDCDYGKLINRVPTHVQCSGTDNYCEEGPDYSPCESWVTKQCFPRHRLCIRDLDFQNSVLYCEKEQHLKSCESFDCPGFFKCPGSYCIPYAHVCNGKIDCIGADDENNCNNLEYCKGKIQCPGNQVCISLSDWCNGIRDCPDYADERNCHQCPAGCDCQINSVHCDNALYDYLSPVYKDKKAVVLRQMKIRAKDMHNLLKRNLDIQYLDLSSNRLDEIKFNTFLFAMKLIYLNLQNNKIREVDSLSFSSIQNLLHLELKGNPITIIKQSAFLGLSYVEKLDLSEMEISVVEDNGFLGLFSLTSLNVSWNNLQSLTDESLSGLTSLKILDISNNPLYMIEHSSFEMLLSLSNLYTPAFKFCCAAAHVGECLPAADQFSSCSDLMANSTLRICVWVLTLTTLLANSSVIIWRNKKEKRTVLSFLVQHLGFSDLLMGLYLFIIAFADFYYKGHYYLWEDQWKRSLFCKFAGFISMLSSEMSVFVLLIIMIERVCIVGFGRRTIKQYMAYMYIVSGWFIFACLSALPIVSLSYFGSGEYIKNGACFLFNITEGKIRGWEYATAIFIVFNLFVVLSLISGYAFTFISLAIKTGFKGNIEGKVAIKLAFIVTTDCLCWIPPIVIGIMSLIGKPVDPQLAVWVAVFVFPLNSTLNPFLYTFSTCSLCSVKSSGSHNDNRKYNAGYSMSEMSCVGPSTVVDSSMVRSSTGRKIGKQEKNSKIKFEEIPEITSEDITSNDETNVAISVSVEIKHSLERKKRHRLDDKETFCVVNQNNEGEKIVSFEMSSLHLDPK